MCEGAGRRDLGRTAPRRGQQPRLGQRLPAVDDEWHKVSGTWSLSERFGPWTCFPLAASVTAGGRLLLAILDRMVEDRGSRVSYRDTDSSVVPSSPEGGTLALPDGSELRELSWGEVDELVAAFAPLAPAST